MSGNGSEKMANENYNSDDKNTDPFYSESNIQYLTSIIKGVENGTVQLTEHELIEVDDE